MKFPELRNLPLIWVTFGIVVLILGLIRLSNPDYEVISWYAVFVHAIIVLLVLSAIPLKIKTIFIGAFLFRLFFMVWDIYARNILELPNSGADSEMYYRIATLISNNLTLLELPIRGGTYAKIVGVLFYITGPQRMLVQYINVLFGLSVVFVIYKILVLLSVSPNVTKTIVAIAAFFPNSMVMSAIFLREIIPTFFVAVSLLYFIQWYIRGGYIRVILSMVMLAFAAVFHSGVIGIFVGYAFFYLFYKKDQNRFSFDFQTIVGFVLVGGFAFMASTQFGDALFGKFESANELEDIYEEANSRLGNSAYLTGMEINNLPQLVVYGPIKMFYFLTSPLPMNWRGGMDIFTFVFDSSLYFITLWYIWKNWRFFRERKMLIIGLIITLIGVAFIFGIGVGNAGTAVRHRQKIIPLMLILLAVMIDEKQKYFNYWQ